MNTCYGYINGQIVPTYSGYNEYHKPQISLNHFWQINGKSTLSTSVYVSNATEEAEKYTAKTPTACNTIIRPDDPTKTLR